MKFLGLVFLLLIAVAVINADPIPEVVVAKGGKGVPGGLGGLLDGLLVGLGGLVGGTGNGGNGVIKGGLKG